MATEVSEKTQAHLEDAAFKRVLDRAAKRNADLSPEAAQKLIEQVVEEDRRKQRARQI